VDSNGWCQALECWIFEAMKWEGETLVPVWILQLSARTFG
jgi:hypothetical protein